ncbi:MAG: hypothetical protein K2M87_07705 [Muribaculaceae bacterium]|nr:hypothetical protein [Muribaculaceae bacterium]
MKLKRFIPKRPRKDLLVSGAFLGVCLLLVGTALWAWHEYMSTPPYVDSERFPVRGFDLSAHNGFANLNAAAEAGYQFVFLKASEGVDFRDENFALNYQKALHAGLKVGAYHFFRFDRDGVEQAKNLLRVVASRPLSLGLVLDVEEAGNAPGIPADSVKNRLALMVEYLNLRGHRVMFYSNRAGYEKFLLPEFEGMPLWICSFNDDNANRDDWTFWQFDHHGRVPGVRGDVDLNTFVGSRRDWEEFTK